MKKINFGVKSKVFVLFLLAFLMSQCANKTANSTGLPTDIRGIRLDMSKDDAHKILEEVAMNKQVGSKKMEIWQLKDDPNFSHIMIGFDREEKLKFVTTTLEKKWLTQKKRMKFSDIGDLSTAKRETVQNINKYFWNVDATDDVPTHQVYTYGDDEEHVLHFSLAKRMDPEEDD